MPASEQGRRASRRDWGWHPLRADWAARVVEGAPVRAGDLVLDLGAGTGALTAPLLDAGARVVAVELHPGRAAALRRRFADAPVRVVAHDLADLRLPGRPFRVVSNPPYQLSTAVLRTLLSTDRLLSADLVLQAGAARRLAAAPPGARHARRFVLDVGPPVPRRAFHPPPRVDSAVLRVRRR
ncbi:23S rRNA (adenine(2058)-N(6))-methyltransferase Erm(37) [Isoptericola hypogeus]|uniref:23S rRNA (Adenine(2058)-N(6))-methyltransferase Erm(37) n=1 Tax=Isoptericola hypogeus TaxID=300179 RepID=A0ABP4V6R4_9MICO